MKRGVFIFWGVFIATAFIRVLMSLHAHAPDIGVCLKQTVRGEGIIAEEPRVMDTGQVLVIQADILSPQSGGASCSKDMLIRMKTKLYPKYIFGDRISFSGKLSKPFNFRSDSGRSFDYVGYLAKDDVFYEIKSATVTLAGAEDAKSSGFLGWLGSFPTKISSALFYLKNRFVANLNSTLGDPHAALAAGLVVGEKAALGKDLLDDFRTVGLIHIVVLSGFNITVVADAMRRLLAFLPRVWGISVGGIGIALFGILVGGGATVVRSCFMAGIALSADLIRRDYDVARALAFAALIMLIQNPSILLHDPSFQLSFLATLGLILFASPIEKRLTFLPEKFGIRGIIASTMATQITVSPYILYMMGQLSIIGSVVNILVLPFIPVTMLAVFLTGASGFVWMGMAHFFGWIAHLLLAYELFMVEQFARIPFAAVHVPPFSGWIVAGVYVAIAVGYVWMERKKKKKTC